jgi:hypothetical protein
LAAGELAPPIGISNGRAEYKTLSQNVWILVSLISETI